MNGAEIHLLLNHIPVVGLFFVVALLAYALIRKNVPLVNISVVITLLLAVVTIPVNNSGEEAEEIVEEMGLDHDLIHEHEEAAELALFLMLGLGGICIAYIFLLKRNEYVAHILSIILLAGCLGTSIYMAQVAHLGGEISHPEIRDGFDLETHEVHEEPHEADDD
ncbi:MAG: hypothetical protein AAF388_22075 [Bacteroidota bacterium]